MNEEVEYYLLHEGSTLVKTSFIKRVHSSPPFQRIDIRIAEDMKKSGRTRSITDEVSIYGQT